ncbi:MBL fold metallo-hydrolase [Nonomuraea sp. H19]|uniref:MBL fold metallo-hydrolase n=1 Tax=Nonomuraea sp. H19 TaxID=3452206 RepID=UPI003F89730F
MDVTATYIGTATVLLRIGDLTVLTDPALDPAGTVYDYPVPVRRTKDPAVGAADLPPVDVVLLSHDQHPDNLDHAGRALLASTGTVITTGSGATRIPGAVGLDPWQSFELSGGHQTARVTATPARHGPEGIEPLAGDVIGFVLEIPGASAALYVSGDTVYYDELDRIGERFTIGTAFLHLGDARVPALGDFSFTLDSSEGARLARSLDAATVVPVHFDSWEHFNEDPGRISDTFADAGLADRLHWLPPGEPYRLAWPSLNVSG